MNLRGQWVWVTGASSGLGKELARQLAFNRGANLVLTARRANLLEELKRDFEANAKVQVRVLTGDMAVSADVEHLVTEALKIDLAAVVLNAGISHFGKHSELDWAEFERLIHINVTSTARLTSELVRHFEKRGTLARIMLVTSMAGLYPVPYRLLTRARRRF
jgi:short-subunit dehydrogenase